MLSVVVSSASKASSRRHRRNVAATIGAAHEYLPVENRGGRLGLGAACNRGAARARGDVLVFAHEDAFFLEEGWGRALERRFCDPSVGLVGVAGTRYLFADDLRWEAAGPPFTRGRIVQEEPGGRRILTVFCPDTGDAEVAAADGVFLALSRPAFERARFDEEAFRGFHFYDLDLCMRVRRFARCLVTWAVPIAHGSAGTRDASWRAAAALFRSRHRTALPASCGPEVPDRRRLRKALHFDLAGVRDGAPVL